MFNRSDELFRLMVESMEQDALFLLDPQGRVASWNVGAQRMFGYGEEEIMAEDYSRLYLAEDVTAGKPQAAMKQSDQTGRQEEDGWRVRKDGSTFWAGQVLIALHDGGEVLRGFSCQIRDMTERRRQEQAVRDSEARMRGIVNTAVDGILTIDERGTIEFVNPAARSIFGYSEAELIGQNVKLLMPEPYHSQHDTYLANYRQTGAAQIIGIGREVMGRRKDGSTFPVDLAVSEVEQGHRRIFTGVVRDITLRKKAEEDLRRAKESAERSAQEAEAANRAKDHFLAVVSHELRTPLTPVLASTSYLETRSDLPQELKNEMGSIRRHLELEARLIDDLLDLTRLNRGKIEIRHDVFDIHASLRAALAMCQADLEAKGIEISLQLYAKSRHIWGDADRIQQVFANLLTNALKFTPEGGRIELRTINENGNIKIQVSDNGIGIESDVLPRLFNAFEQGEKSITRRYGGLGLGLTICRMLTEMHGGSISAQSDGSGKGAAFTVRLAVVPAPEKPVPSSPLGQSMPRSMMKVLYVEDHAPTMRVMSLLLRRMGVELKTATTVKQAIELAGQEQFDLLLSDIGLPDGTGMDVMRGMKGREKVRGIALSGWGADEDKIRSREAGFVEHLTKPVTFDALEKAIQRLAP